jgi:hypothetical protein
MKTRQTILATLFCALSGAAAMNVQAAAPVSDAPATPAATAATGASAPAAAKPAGHVTARNMQLRSAKFAACRKETLDRGLSGEELKKALLDCMN